MNKIILLAIVALAFTSCSNYTYYWHEEEDDVYFVSLTDEVVDMEEDFEFDEDEDDSWSGYEERRYPDNRRNRRNRSIRGYQPPVVIGGSRDRDRSIKSGRSDTPSSPTRKSPAPTRSSKPSTSGKGNQR